MEGGDRECVQRMVDFNSSLFKPEIGFPFGKSLRDALYEYSTISSTQEPLVRDVETKIEKYLKTPYVARWTLKVTWEKAPAYPSQLDDTQTSTYQVILTTDGNRSFALLLYQDGGMRWDYTKLAASNVLIGFSSGDGYAQNNELTQKPPAVKYRPDQHSSTGTDVRGLWIYRLDSRSRVNYRLRCLAWLDTQPAPAAWNKKISSRSGGVCDRLHRFRASGRLYWELEAFDWCCQRVGKPLFCTRFAEKRPRVGCEGYVPPTPAGAFGDPHITTLDGLTYTFNGLGDFVLLLASNARTSFELQGRTAQTGTAQATNFIAFAARYTSATSTTVEWTLGSQGDMQVLLNGKNIQFSYSQDMAAEVYYSPGILLVNASSITAIFDGAIAVSISATSGILSVVCSMPDQYRNSTKGLLGVWDHDPADDFQMPNGTNISVNSSEEEIYSYGMTWAVGKHGLFAQPLDSPVMNFTPIFLSWLRQVNESQYQLAASQCRGSKECIYDALSTGDVALGLATQSLAADFQQKKTVLKSGALTWEPLGTAPFTVNLEAVGSNNLSALLQLRFTLCSCSRSQECDYSDAVTLGRSSLQLAACRCDGGYSGPFCQDPPDPCAQGCFPGVDCDSDTGCGPCPAGLIDIDECAQGTVCPGNATCTNTVGSYICSCPVGEKDLPRRSIRLRLRALQNVTAEEVNGTVSAILGSLEVKAFQSNTNITQTTDGDGFTFTVVSEFAYDSRGTIIQFLNEELPGAITGAFNRWRRRREVGTHLHFQRLHRDNVTDLVKLTVAELRVYFPCGLLGYKGYQLHFVGTIGFTCISPCKTGYCQHGGRAKETFWRPLPFFCKYIPVNPTPALLLSDHL
nr:PREDICTED: mucin-4 [Opisthocomus hoazin]